MVFFEWNDSLCVGVQSVDDQHRKLFDLINRLYASMKEGKAAQAVGGVLNELADYTIYHFSEEEALMKKAGYIGFLQHKKEHDAFIFKIKEEKQKFDAGKQMLIGFEIANFLKDWLKDHIMINDMKYRPDMQKAGIK